MKAPRRNLVYFGNVWDDFWRRRQQIAYHLAQREKVDRVIYVEHTSLTLTSLIKVLLGGADADARARWRRVWRQGPIAQESKVLIVTRFCLFPSSFGEVLTRVDDSISHRLLSWILNRLLRGSDEIILWVGHPAHDAGRILGHFGEVFFCYDCADEHWRINQAHRLSEVEANDKEFTHGANLVLANSEYLYERKKAINPNTYLMPNGVDLSPFPMSFDEAPPMPTDLQSVPHPIIGYVGSMFHRHHDLDLLLSIAERQPGWSLVFIGPTDNSGNDPETQCKVDLLRARPNVCFLGAKPYRELPGYLCHFDVCISVYKEIKLNDSASSLKLLVYLAAGKPVVTTNTGGASRFRDAVHTASDPESFVAKIEQCLAEHSQEMANAQRRIAAENAWEKKGDEIWAIIERHIET